MCQPCHTSCAHDVLKPACRSSAWACATKPLAELRQAGFSPSCAHDVWQGWHIGLHRATMRKDLRHEGAGPVGSPWQSVERSVAGDVTAIGFFILDRSDKQV